MAALMCLAFPAPLLAKIDEEEAVSSGAKALDSWWNYPWYDDKSDTIRRIDLQAKSQVAPSQATSGTDWSFLELLGWLLIAVAAIAVLYMLLRVYWNRQPRLSSADRAGLVGAASSVDRLEELPFNLERPAGDLLSAARHAFEQANYDRAIVLLYSHQLLELDKRDLIRLTKGKTNRQYLRELRSRPDLAPLLATSMVAFEDVFFGGHSLDRERFERCWQDAMRLLEAREIREAA